MDVRPEVLCTYVLSTYARTSWEGMNDEERKPRGQPEDRTVFEREGTSGRSFPSFQELRHRIVIDTAETVHVVYLHVRARRVARQHIIEVT